jgi:hypothetical protein
MYRNSQVYSMKEACFERQILIFKFSYQILKSYLSDRYFYVKYQEEQTALIPIESGVQQGSVLGPVLYLLYTADLPTLRQTTVATFADDTAVSTSHSDPKNSLQPTPKKP